MLETINTSGLSLGELILLAAQVDHEVRMRRTRDAIISVKNLSESKKISKITANTLSTMLDSLMHNINTKQYVAADADLLRIETIGGIGLDMED